jgi:Pyruvate/2-oxoacid:ferredoxin oxidoreductase gamma subunit
MVFVQSHRSNPVEIWESIPAWAVDEREERAPVCAGYRGIAKEASRADLRAHAGHRAAGHFSADHTVPGGAAERRASSREKSLRKYFASEQVVQDNLKAVQRGYKEVIEVPRDVMLATAQGDKAKAALRVM